MSRTTGSVNDRAICQTGTPAVNATGRSGSHLAPTGPSTAGPTAPAQRLTEELLERLLASSTIDRFLDSEEFVDRSLPAYLHGLLEPKGLHRADVVRASGINATVVYDIFAGKSRPGRDHALMLAFGLGCDLRETQRLLRLAGVAELWSRNRRDAIVIWCVANGYSRAQTDDELYRFGEKTLLSYGSTD